MTDRIRPGRYRLRMHRIQLRAGRLTLRPMTESDWEVLLAWNNDPDVLRFAEAGDITSWTLPAMQAMYRGVSRRGHCFIIELDGRPIGEAWLQKMNLPRVLDAYPEQHVRRIDLAIGAKELWGQGWGSKAIRLLVRLAFDHLGVDLLYEPEIADTNPRSRRAFEKNGFAVVAEIPQAPGAKFSVGYDMALTRADYERRQATHPRNGRRTSGSPGPVSQGRARRSKSRMRERDERLRLTEDNEGES